jgi:tRNA(fMet)-specific endonuclease VapC
MFVILDTDHFSAVDRQSAAGERLQRRIASFDGDIFISVITIEEVMRGWISMLGSRKKLRDEIGIYQRLRHSAEVIGDWDVLPWEADSLALFEHLRAQRIRMSTMDLKIACIALLHEATLLTRNLTDFRKVPGLKVENWLD